MSDSRTLTEIEGLVLRLRSGDTTARDALLLCAWERLTRLAHRMLGDYPKVRRRLETGDIVVPASWRLCRALEDPDHLPTSARHFLRLAALQIRRELIDLARRYQNEPPLVPWPDGESDPDGSCVRFEPPDGTNRDPEHLAWWTAFHETVDRLPDNLRDVVDLLWYQGLTQAEAASVLGGISTKTVRNRWVEARLRLCDALGGHPSWS
jgi:RNA polymerase sigma-70 factor (ECF subfamily)